MRKPKKPNSILLVLTLLLFATCSDDTSEPTGPKAAAVTGVVLDDITNNGNSSDYEVSFSKLEDEGTIAGYRVYLVKSDDVLSFTLDLALSLPEERYLTISKTGEDVKVLLLDDMLDVDGNLIEENGTTYQAFVMTIADRELTVVNALSSPSNGIKLSQTTIKITYINHSGVHISDGSNAILIDAFSENTSSIFDVAPAPGLIDAIINGEDDFGNVKVLMNSHLHRDHLSPRNTRSFLTANPEVLVVGPEDVREAIDFEGNMSNVAPAFGEVGTVDLEGIKITVFGQRHYSTQQLPDLAEIDNYAYLIEMDGKKILHLGDAEYSDLNHKALFDLGTDDIDLVFIPLNSDGGFNNYALINAQTSEFVRQHFPNSEVIALHVRAFVAQGHGGAGANSTLSIALNEHFPDVRVWNRSLMFTRL